MTAHKSQGQTMTKVIIDLQSCRGMEAPYIMVSRVTSLEGLLVLRPFHFAKISCRQSQETRTEFRRLEIIQLKTTADIGSMIEKETAQKLLSLHTSVAPSTNQDARDQNPPKVSTSLTKRWKKKITNQSHDKITDDDPNRTIPSATSNIDSAISLKNLKRPIDLTNKTNQLTNEMPVQKKRKLLKR